MPSRLDWILSPLAVEEFIENYWEKRFVHIQRSDHEYYRDLFSIDMFEEALIRNPPSLSWVSADQSSRTQLSPNRGYNSVDVERAIEAFSTGSTIILDALHKHYPPLRRLCLDLEALLGIRFQANAYLTPPGRQGFKPHYDTHDVLVMQIHGSKRWRIGEEAFKFPLLVHNDLPGSRTIGQDYAEFSLAAGDVLYIPRGVVHEATSESGSSLHITLGILSYTWADVISSCVATAIDHNPAIRGSLPLNFSQNQHSLHNGAADFLAQIAAPGVIADAIESFMVEYNRAREDVLEGKLSSLLLFEDENAQDIHNYFITGRKTFFDVLEDDSQVTIKSFEKDVVLPAYTSVAVRSCLQAQMAKASDLDRGDLEWPEFVVVLKRLAREGLLIAERP